MSRVRLPIWSSRLLWKLTVSYFIITLTVITVYILIDIETEYRDVQLELNAASIVKRTEREASRFAPLIYQGEVNAVAVEHLLFRLKYELENRRAGLAITDYFALGDFKPEALALCIISAKGSEIARAGPFEDSFKDRLSQIIKRGDVGDGEGIIAQDNETRCVAALIRDQTGGVAGAMMLRLTLPRHWWNGISLGSIIGDLRLIDLAVMALMSLTFGFIIARQLTKRLERISTAADAWAKGDFSAVADDRSSDELGELSQRLNRMAKDLREIVALRQNLAASEERNRLARDLHDTVKQRAFALSMQIGATQSVLEHDCIAAQKRLTEAEKLAYQIQRELVTILEELRPDAAGDKELSAALREMVSDWARQSGVQAKLQCEETPKLSFAARSELFRILQEALANVARHSGARSVFVRFSRNDASGVQGVKLLIEDDGCGFDPEKVTVGMGLRNMRERAKSLSGGNFKIEKVPAGGARIEIVCHTDADVEKK